MISCAGELFTEPGLTGNVHYEQSATYEDLLDPMKAMWNRRWKVGRHALCHVDRP